MSGAASAALPDDLAECAALFPPTLADRLRVRGQLALSARKRSALSAPHRAGAQQPAGGLRRQDRGCRITAEFE